MTLKSGNFHRVSELDLERAAAMWARAFDDGAFYVWVMPDPDVRSELLRELFKVRLKLGILFGEVYVTPNFEGGAHWMPSEHSRISEEKMFDAGALEFAEKLQTVDSQAMPKIQRYLEIAEPLHEELAPFPHLYLASIAVEPTHQRKGHGTALLTAMLKHMDQQRMHVYLETNALNNISYYERLGFTVKRHVSISDSGPPLWAMIREPQ